MNTVSTSKGNGTKDNVTQIANLPEFKQKKAETDHAAWMDKLQISLTTGAVKKTSYANAAVILSNDTAIAPYLAYNEFTGEIVTKQKIQEDGYKLQSPAGVADGSMIGDLQILVDNAYKASFSTDIMTKAALYAARKHTFNPLLDRLKAARDAWIQAGKPEQLTKFFVNTLGAADTPATHAMTRLFFDGLITRAHKPGEKFDYMTILYSQQQGIGKTWLLSRLGGEYYTDSLMDMKSKDAVQLVAQKWLVNDDELSVSTDHRNNPFPVVKTFITRTNDDFRPPYTAKVERFPRRFVLAGTTNEKDILKDATGSRRHNIITCGVGKIITPVKDLTDEDILLYLGEAEDRYQRGACKLVATLEEQAAIDEAKQSFEAEDSTAATLDTVLNALYPANWWKLPREAQRTWIARIIDNNGDKNTLPAVAQLDRVNIPWLLDRAFKLDNTNAKTAQYERLRSALIEQMNAKPDWEKPPHSIRFNESSRRGYLRTKV